MTKRLLPDPADLPSLWGPEEFARAVEVFAAAVAKSFGPATFDLSTRVCGAEGCVVFGEHPELGQVVLKVGRDVIDRWTAGADRSDFSAAAEIRGLHLPGVALVFEVWRADEGLYGLLRERVNMDMRAYAAAIGMDEEWMTRMLASGTGALNEALMGHHRLCEPGRRGKGPNREEWVAAMADVEWTGLSAIVAGAEALEELGICVGDDIRAGNVGWRLDADGDPEPVIVDLGVSSVQPGVAWRGEPRHANRGGRPMALPATSTPPYRWTKDEGKAVLGLFLDRIEATMGPLRVRVGSRDCGGEGCVYRGSSPEFGDVVVKVGPGRSLDRRYRSDFTTSRAVQGQRIPGIAMVHLVLSDGPWRALVRELVSTDWRTYAKAMEVPFEVVDLGLRALIDVTKTMHRRCATGVGPVDHRTLSAVQEAGLTPVLDGIEALHGMNVCVGTDVHRRNVGWRLDPEGQPEPVILDLGMSQQPRRER